MIRFKDLCKRIVPYVIAVILSVMVYLLFAAWRGLDSQLFGNDIYGHLYRIERYWDYLTKNVDYGWYSGTVLFGSWPAGVYFFINTLCGGSIYRYYLMTGIVACLPFVYLGIRKNNPVAGIIAGVIYPYTPVILKIELIEGNLCWYMAAIIIPYVIVNLYLLLNEQEKDLKSYLKIIIPGVLFYLSLFSIHYMLAAFTGMMIGIAVIWYAIGLLLRHKNFGEDYLRTKLTAVILYLFTDGAIAMGMYLTFMSSTVSSLGKDEEGWIWNHSLLTSLFISKGTNYYFGLVITVIMAAIILRTFCRGENSFLDRNLVLRIFAMVPPLYIIWCAIPVELYESTAFGSLFRPERFSAIAMSATLVAAVAASDLKIVKPGLKALANICVAFMIIDCLLYMFLGDVTTYDTDFLDEAVAGTEKDVKTGIIDTGASCYEIYTVGDNTSGWGYQGADSREYLWTQDEAMRAGDYNYALLKMSEQCCGDFICLRAYFEDEDKDEAYKTKEETKFIKLAETYGYELVNQSDSFLVFSNGRKNFVSVVDYKNAAVGDWATNFSIYFDSSFNKIYINDSVEDSLQYILDSGVHYEKLYIYPDENIFDYEDLIEELRDRGTDVCVDLSALAQYEYNGRVLGCDMRSMDVERFGETITTAVLGTGEDQESEYEREVDGITFVGQNPIYYYMNYGEEAIAEYDWLKDLDRNQPVSVTFADVTETTDPATNTRVKTFNSSAEGICYTGTASLENYANYTAEEKTGSKTDDSATVFTSDSGIMTFPASGGSYTINIEESAASVCLKQTIIFCAFYLGLILLLILNLASYIYRRKTTGSETETLSESETVADAGTGGMITVDEVVKFRHVKRVKNKILSKNYKKLWQTK